MVRTSTLLIFSIFLAISTIVILTAIVFTKPNPQMVKEDFELSFNQFAKPKTEKSNFLNHGSYGSTPIQVSEVRDDIENEISKFEHAANMTEADVFEYQRNLYQEALISVANFTQLSNPSDKIWKHLLLDYNATGSWNHILRYFITFWINSSNFSNFKVNFFYTEQTYGAMLNAAKYRLPKTTNFIEMKVNDLYIGNIQKYLTNSTYNCQDPNSVSIFFLDYIHSGSATKYSDQVLAEMTQSIRTTCGTAFQNSFVILDAAHAPGTVENLKIETIDADFFIGNLHKWTFTSKTASFIYSRKNFNELVNPKGAQFVEYFFEKLTQSSNFEALVTAQQAISFYQNEAGGFSGIQSHCNSVFEQGIQELIKIPNFIDPENPFHTETDKPITMRTLRLTQTLQDRIQKTNTQGGFLLKYLMQDYDSVIAWTGFDDQWWIRVSCNIYNFVEDYKNLAVHFDYVLNQMSKADFYNHQQNFASLNTHSPSSLVTSALKNYRHLHQSNPDLDMRVERRKHFYNAANEIAVEFIGNNFPTENLGFGLDGAEDLLDAVRDMIDIDFSGQESDFLITDNLEAEKGSYKYLIIDGTKEVGKYPNGIADIPDNDAKFKQAIQTADIFILGMDAYLMGPKGLALIAINNDFLRQSFQPTIVSWDTENSFQSKTSMQATRDYAPAYAGYDTIKSFLLSRFLFPDSKTGYFNGRYQKYNYQP